MASDFDFLEPRQDRSKKTLARLLRSAIETLDRHGLDGSTIPRIAGAAGVAPATIYRRFRDRDALLRAAILYALEMNRKENQSRIALENFKVQTLEGVVAAITGAVIAQNRAHPRLLKALMRFVESDNDETFHRKVLAINAGMFEPFVDVLLHFSDEIRHPNPRHAILFALLTMGTVVEERALESVSMWHELLPLPDEEMKRELAHSCVSYLRCTPA